MHKFSYELTRPANSVFFFRMAVRVSETAVIVKQTTFSVQPTYVPRAHPRLALVKLQLNNISNWCSSWWFYEVVDEKTWHISCMSNFCTYVRRQPTSAFLNEFFFACISCCVGARYYPRRSFRRWCFPLIFFSPLGLLPFDLFPAG